MKVILLKDIKNLGKMGDILNIKDGYVRNFLLPKNLAKIATPSTEAQVIAEKNAKEQKNKEEQDKFLALAKTIAGMEISIKAKASDDGTLYGAINGKIIAEQLKKINIDIGSGEEILDKPIKQIGKHEISLTLPYHQKTKILINIEHIK